MRKLLLLAIASYLAFAFYASANKNKTDCRPFYDGEGNEIPESVVRLYVTSHFVLMTKREMDSINKYFYFNKLIQ